MAVLRSAKTADPDLLSLPRKYRAALQDARQTIKALEAEIRLRTDISDTIYTEDPGSVDQLREKRAEPAKLIETIRQNNPDFMPIGLDLAKILALIPPKGALAAPVFTPESGAIFVIPHGAREVTPEHVIHNVEYRMSLFPTLRCSRVYISGGDDF